MAATNDNPEKCSLRLSIAGVTFRVYFSRREGRPGWDLKRILADAPESIRVEKDRWGAVSCSCGEPKSRHGECRHARALYAVHLIAPSFHARNKKSDAVDCVV